MKSAMQSDALVSSLFPEDVRTRIYEEMNSKAQAKAHESNWRSKGGDANRNDDSNSQDDSTAIARLYPETTIFFADLVGFTGAVFVVPLPTLNVHNYCSLDLLALFAAWSSKRTPTEVFQVGCPSMHSICVSESHTSSNLTCSSPTCIVVGDALRVL